MKLNPTLVKRALAGHSWLGLLVGAAMYAICLSGALLVFHAELERWEQPEVAEFNNIDVHGMAHTFNTYLEQSDAVTPHMYLVLPTAESPRARLASEDASWFLNQDGTLGAAEDNGWSEMLLQLHLYLHLPETWGMILVSITGAMLVALIVSGLLAHPKIFRDAFNLRLGGSPQLEQTDIHNRLSVWGAPFFLMIAITGAYFGLALPNLGFYAQVEYNGDQDQVVAKVFGEEPALDQPVELIQVESILAQVHTLAPQAEQLLLVVHDAGQRKQHVSVSAFHPQRLVYAENYLFSAAGEYLGSEGFIDGAAGKQVVYSIYRLHFGNFAGTATKWMYLLLGFAMTVVSASGINLWLARRRHQDVLNDIWVGFVWGLPIALTMAACLKLATDTSANACLWLSLIACLTLCVWVKNPQQSRLILRAGLAFCLLALFTIHLALYRSAALRGSAGAVNATLLLVALLIFAGQIAPLRRSLIAYESRYS